MDRKQSSRLIQGAVAGGLATIWMSLFMFGSKKLGIQGEHPPKRIAEFAFALAGSEQSEQQKLKLNASAVAAHLGFGMVAGGAFALIQPRSSSKKLQILHGIGYGLLVWAASYKGWIPAFNILPPPERDRPGRVKSMIAAHMVYGAVLANLMKGEPRKSTVLLR
ncbi:DUF6789 family protein [Pedosphaera parvula]|uniref:DUF1440 domain-containing protein n=1 Tax=Pedosphaera parvula (strain Ellin514) TaxID=320771 RepID=B9XGQ4_PEDPL|nr:DUF6789 family protein [Pedosphaera parvula]EEF61105.1 conserved hypothetical protein [Pedosphaera parvula Ellin514]